MRVQNFGTSRVADLGAKRAAHASRRTEGAVELTGRVGPDGVHVARHRAHGDVQPRAEAVPC